MVNMNNLQKIKLQLKKKRIIKNKKKNKYNMELN